MYTQTNNRIITKYSEYVRSQDPSEPKALFGIEEITPEVTPPPTAKHVISKTNLPVATANIGDSDISRVNLIQAGDVEVLKAMTSAEVHQHRDVDEVVVAKPGDGDSEYKSSKFSELFDPASSHALYQRDLLIQSEEGSFLREAAERKARLANTLMAPIVYSNPIDRESGLASLDVENELTWKKRQDVPERKMPPMVFDLDGPQITPNLATNEASLRRELLNNIRAISHATFFENLYTGNSLGRKSPGNNDMDDSGSDTNNNPSTAANNAELEEFLHDSGKETLIISEKGEHLIFESGSDKGSAPSLPVGPEQSVLDKETSIHQWILNSQNVSPDDQTLPPTPQTDVEVPVDIAEDSKSSIQQNQAESDVVSPDLDAQDSKSLISNDSYQLHDSMRDDEIDAPSSSSSSKNDDDGFSGSSSPIPSPAPRVVTPKPKKIINEAIIVTDKEISSVNSTPLKFRRIYLQDESTFAGTTPSQMSYSRMMFPVTTGSSVPMSIIKQFRPPMDHNNISNPTSQVTYPGDILRPIPSPPPEPPATQRRGKFGTLPGVLLRHNMDQWVAKILRFYVNGDEHLSHFEFRFRPGRDVHSFDRLCDILSQRMKLSRGVRYIFTMDGQPIWSMDDLKHGHSYVVSSIKKFKALNYGGDDGTVNDGRKRRGRPPSAPNQRHPPVICVRRERSLNGVTWGSPQGGVGNPEDGERSILRSAMAAERVLRAAIEESQSQQTNSKQVIRIINGSDPTIQSQILLNTRVNQEFDELVRDLGLTIKIPRGGHFRMETLTGRTIQSYSQLRSELLAGNEAFYIYNQQNPNHIRSNRNVLANNSNYLQKGVPNLSKSLSNPILPVLESALGSKFPNSYHNPAQGKSKLQVPYKSQKAASSSSIYDDHQSRVQNNQFDSSKSPQATKPSQLTNSNPNLTHRRKSVRRRYETSTYLVQQRSPRAFSP